MALGVIAAAIGVSLAYAYVLSSSPAVLDLLLAGQGVEQVAVLIAGTALNAMGVVALVAVGVEYALSESGRIEHDGLLLEAPLERFGGEAS